MPESASAILTNELNRLTAKKTSIDNAHATQKRLMILNDSYRKRYSKYTQMIALFVFCVISVLALNAMAKALPFIPGIIFTAATFIVVVYCVFRIISLYFEIQSRSRLNYDELDIPSTVDTSMNAVSFDVGKEDKTGELNLGRIYDLLRLNGISACVAGDCCPENYEYDYNANKCKVKTAFTLMSDVPEMSRGSSNVFATELGTPISSSVATTGERYVEQRFMYKKE
jgi:hypothetical protein